MIILRRAKEEDCAVIYQLRNHPAVRKGCFCSEPIEFADHRGWFKDSLKRDNRIILLAYHEGEVVGVLRFDLLGHIRDVAEVSIYIAPQLHGQGWGSKVLQEGESWLLQNTEIRTIIARVKEQNEASVKLFTGSGFTLDSMIFKRNVPGR